MLVYKTLKNDVHLLLHLTHKVCIVYHCMGRCCIYLLYLQFSPSHSCSAYLRKIVGFRLSSMYTLAAFLTSAFANNELLVRNQYFTTSLAI